MKVIKISEELVFEDGTRLYSNHEQDCCENHYLDFDYVSMEDFEGLDFDLSNDNFFETIDGYGIHLKPTNGLSVPIPGYGSNNGYYSTNLELVLMLPNGTSRTYDISDCQNIDEYK